MNTILLMQPNYAILGKRSWPLPPYNLALLKAVVGDIWNTRIFDFNSANASEEFMRARLRELKPDVVGITSFSTEYAKEVHYHAKIVRETLPKAIILLGGVFPTVQPEIAMRDLNVDCCLLGEGEKRFPLLLQYLESGGEPPGDGFAFREDGEIIINPPIEFVEDLDAVPLPDYDSLDVAAYGARPIKFAQGLITRQYPYGVTITSRGCPFKCIFCAGRTISGVKVRLRSAENVLKEVKWMRDTYGIREIIFLDDHFLHRRSRAEQIMRGIHRMDSTMTWKCVNVAVFALDEALLDLMMETGCYQITLSIESGVENTLSNIILKPVNLDHARRIVQYAQSIGMEVISNFVIGFPGESWGDIRKTIAYADSLDLDLTNFHIATPLPKTRLMEICLERGYINSSEEQVGYTEGVIKSDEWNSRDLQILRAYEWDRINFSTAEKIATIARMQGLTVEEVATWRKNTRDRLGSTKNFSTMLANAENT